MTVEFLLWPARRLTASPLPTRNVVYAMARAVVLLFVHRIRQGSILPDRALQAVAIAAFTSLVGSRLYYLFGTGTGVSVDARAMSARRGAGSSGGYIGGFVGVWAYAKVARTNPPSALDVAASAAALAPVIGRWGSLLAGCDFGRITAVPWATHYTSGGPAFASHIQGGPLAANAPQSLPVHPLPIYLILNALVLFEIITAIWRRARHRPGTTIAAAWALYGVTRFCLEFLRDPAASWAEARISIAQWMALVSIGIGLAIAVLVARRIARPMPASAPVKAG